MLFVPAVLAHTSHSWATALPHASCQLSWLKQHVQRTHHVAAGLTSCCVQVWASSAYGCLPSSASVNPFTTSMFGTKSPLRRLDRGHWSLMSGLVVVSAVYLLREHGLNKRERRLRKELINSQVEISKLIMKVIRDLQFAPVTFNSAGTYSSTLSGSRINSCGCGFADRQHAALHAISRASANHPPHLQHVYCDTFPTNAACVSPLLFS